MFHLGGTHPANGKRAMKTIFADDLTRVLDFLDDEAERAAAAAAAEKRNETRSAQTLIVELLALDECLRPVGEMNLGVSRDISRHGTSIFAELPPGAKYARVRFPVRNGGRVEALIRIAWCKQVGRMSEFGGPVIRPGEGPDTAPANISSSLVPLQP